MSTPPPTTIKLVVLGSSGVGKTSLRAQAVHARFSSGYRATIGSDFITKTLPHPTKQDAQVVIQIWDTAGQERFSALSSAFYRGADAVLLMYDVTSHASLDSLPSWWQKFSDVVPSASRVCLVVAGNKVDLDGEVLVQDAISVVESLLPQPETSTIHENVPRLLLSGAVQFVKSAKLALPPVDIKRLAHSRSRSRSHSRFYGTATSRATFHTASSSLHSASASGFDTAPSSPWHSPSPSVSDASPSPSTSTSSMATVRPGDYSRRSTSINGDAAQHDRELPDARPALFLTSAKTGEGVQDVLTHVAVSVIKRWEWEEANGTHVSTNGGDDEDGSVVRLTRSSSFREQLKRQGCCEV